jgi:hypothetical protein
VGWASISSSSVTVLRCRAVFLMVGLGLRLCHGRWHKFQDRVCALEGEHGIWRTGGRRAPQEASAAAEVRTSQRRLSSCGLEGSEHLIQLRPEVLLHPPNPHLRHQPETLDRLLEGPAILQHLLDILPKGGGGVLRQRDPAEDARVERSEELQLRDRATAMLQSPGAR